MIGNLLQAGKYIFGSIRFASKLKPRKLSRYRMKHLERFHAYLLLTFCRDFFAICASAADLEPQPCVSRFDYDHKMMSKITELESTVKTLKEKRIVSFMAELSAHLESAKSKEIVVFDRILSRNSNAYNNNTGIFSAPYNGLYAFSLDASSVTKYASTAIHLLIMKNAERIGYIFLDSNTDYWLRRSSSAVLSLEAGDQVYVNIDHFNQATLAGCCMHTVFSGFLIG